MDKNKLKQYQGRDPEKQFKPQEIADRKLINRTVRTIRKMIKDGILEATNYGTDELPRWLIDIKEIRKFTKFDKLYNKRYYKNTSNDNQTDTEVDEPECVS